MFLFCSIWMRGLRSLSLYTCMYVCMYLSVYLSQSNSIIYSIIYSTLTMQSNGLPERLQVCFYRWTCLRGRGSAWRHHCKSWRSPGATWRWGFTTEEADKILTPNSPPPFLHPCQDIFVSSLMTDLNSQLITPLMGINALWKMGKKLGMSISVCKSGISPAASMSPNVLFPKMLVSFKISNKGFSFQKLLYGIK